MTPSDQTPQEGLTAELIEAAKKIADQIEAEFTVDGSWSRQGQLVTHHAYKRLRAAIANASQSQ